jgi:predicted Zn-dependent protease
LAAVVAFEGRAYLRALDRKEALRLCHQGRFPDAEPMLKNALEWEANDLEVIQALAQGYVGTGQVNEADTFLSRWCVLQPAEVQPHLLRLQLLPKIGKLTEAVAEAEQVLAVQPENQQVQRQVLQLLLRDGRFAETEQACRRFLQRQPNHHGLLYFLVKSLHVQGKNQEAKALLDRLIQEQPEYPEPLILRGIMYQEDGQDAEAIAWLRRGLAGHPSHNAARYHLAKALAHTGQAAEAEREMAAFLRQERLERMVLDIPLQPDNLELRIQAAEALLNSSRAEEGVRLLHEVLARQPKHETARRLLASYRESTSR